MFNIGNSEISSDFNCRDFEQIVRECEKLVARKSLRKKLLSLFSTKDVKEKIQDMKTQINSVQNRFLVSYFPYLCLRIQVFETSTNRFAIMSIYQ